MIKIMLICENSKFTSNKMQNSDTWQLSVLPSSVRFDPWIYAKMWDLARFAIGELITAHLENR